MQRAGGLLLAACLLATGASAQTAGSEGLSPTLANIKKTHVVRLGYRESSPPFSFLDQANRPIGYSLELCEAVVDEIGVEVDDANLKIEYVKVTSDDRIPAVVQNKIDLECGSTTANAERAKQVAFSPLMFVAGTKLMVPKASTHRGACGPEGQDRGGDQRHHQRAGDAQCRQEVLARPQHRDLARPRAVLPDAGGRQGRRVRDRRHPALRPDRAAQVAGQVQASPANTCPTIPTASCSARASRNWRPWSSAPSASSAPTAI